MPVPLCLHDRNRRGERLGIQKSGIGLEIRGLPWVRRPSHKEVARAVVYYKRVTMKRSDHWQCGFYISLSERPSVIHLHLVESSYPHWVEIGQRQKRTHAACALLSALLGANQPVMKIPIESPAVAPSRGPYGSFTRATGSARVNSLIRGVNLRLI